MRSLRTGTQRVGQAFTWPAPPHVLGFSPPPMPERILLLISYRGEAGFRLVTQLRTTKTERTEQEIDMAWLWAILLGLIGALAGNQVGVMIGPKEKATMLGAFLCAILG